MFCSALLCSVLQVGLHADLMKRNFDRALLQIWLVTISELKSQADSISDVSPSAVWARHVHISNIRRVVRLGKGTLFYMCCRLLVENELQNEQGRRRPIHSGVGLGGGGGEEQVYVRSFHATPIAVMFKLWKSRGDAIFSIPNLLLWRCPWK